MPETFEKWMKKVDQLCRSRLGVSADDLPDMLYRDMFENGETPAEAFETVIESAMPEGE